MSLIIFGSGGHAGVVIDAVHSHELCNIDGLIDETIPVGSIRHGFATQHTVDYPEAYQFFIGIGDLSVRERISQRELSWVNVIHLSSIQADQIDCHGTFFGAFSTVGPGSKVGNFCILNTGAILPHDSSIGDYTHLCPRVIMGGHVKIGSRCMIGLGAMIRDHITIGDNCTIGMGSVVLKNVPDNTTVWGNPAKVQYEHRRL